MKDTRRFVPALVTLAALSLAPLTGALAQEKPSAPAPSQPPAEKPAPESRTGDESDPDAPEFTKPVVYTGGRIVARNPADHIGVSQIGFVKDMRYFVPRGWKKEPPIDPLGLAQFRVPSDQPDGKSDAIVVFYDSMDGSVHEVLNDWLNEIEEPEWTPEIEVWMLDFGTETGLNVTLLSGVGTYIGEPLLGGEYKPQPNAMLLGAIIEGSPKGTLYLKAVGHKNVLMPDAGWWQRMVRSFMVTKPPSDYLQPRPGEPGQPTRPPQRRTAPDSPPSQPPADAPKPQEKPKL